MSSAVATDKPNVVFFLADDLGYSDIACYGATKVKTPHLDRLAKEGIQFTEVGCGCLGVSLRWHSVAKGLSLVLLSLKAMPQILVN